MAEPAVSYSFTSDATAGEPLQRCCSKHPDWQTLTEHLIDGFPQLAIGDLVREVGSAREAVEQVALSTDDALEVGELIVRHQLLMRAGHIREAARLDPERHDRSRS